MAPSEATRFFKVILSSTLHQGKLKIPNKFVKELSKTVRLCIPTGSSWSVRIERETDNTIWLHDGLDKFMEDNSIGIEYILVFKYKEKSEFGVQIFDLTATEIQYTCIDDYSRNRDGLEHILQAETGEGENDSDGVECLGSSPPTMGVSRRCYYTRARKQVIEGEIEDENNSTMYKNATRNDGTSAFQGDFGKERIIEPEKKSSPNLFMVTLKPCNIENKILRVPIDFARLHMPRSTRLIKLVDAEDNEWVVRYIHRHHHNALTSGWGHFVKENKLMVGDVCTFEHVRGGDEVKLSVTTSRLGKQVIEGRIEGDIRMCELREVNDDYEDNVKTNHCGKSSTMCKDTGTYASPSDFGKEKKIEPENEYAFNFFKVTLKPSYIENGVLRVPIDFARLHMPRSTRLIKLVDTENNEWAVRYIHKLPNARLRSGWGHFVQDKKLMVGDVCTFEQVRGDDEVKLRVSISRSGGKNSTMYKDATRNDCTNVSPSDFGKERIIEPGNNSSAFFKVILKRSNIEKRLLRIPSDFALFHMPHSTIIIKLVDAENNEWAVRYIHQRQNYVLSSGWVRFVQDKKLMVGDVCTFERERVRGDDEVKLRVTITRSGKQREL